MKHRLSISVFVYSVIFSLCNVLGKCFYGTNDFRLIFEENLFLIFAKFILLTAITYFGCIAFAKITDVIESNSSVSIAACKKRTSYFFVTWLVMMLCWIPAFFVFYPGMDSYDFSTQAKYAFGEGFSLYSTHHPPLHTMYIEFMIKLAGMLNVFAVSLIGVFQTIVLSGVFTLFIWWMLKKGCHKLFAILVFVFFSINPVIYLFVLTPTKDVLLAPFMLLFVMQFVDFIECSGCMPLHRYALMGLTILMCCLMRNNVAYGFILALPIILVYFKKKLFKAVCVFAIPIVLFFAINNLVFINLMGISEGDDKEKLCIVMQQVATVVTCREDELTEADKESIAQYFKYDEISSLYNPRFADSIKRIFCEETYDNDKSSFWRLWLRLGTKFPAEYINSFLSLNMPYWYQFADTVDPFSNADYIETGNVTYTKAGTMYNFFSGIAKGNSLNRFFGFGGLFSLATPFWSLMLAMALLVHKKCAKYIIVLTPCMGFMISFFAGPISNFRYVFPLVCLYPMLFYMCIYFGNREKQSSESDNL